MIVYRLTEADGGLQRYWSWYITKKDGDHAVNVSTFPLAYLTKIKIPLSQQTLEMKKAFIEWLNDNVTIEP